MQAKRGLGMALGRLPAQIWVQSCGVQSPWMSLNSHVLHSLEDLCRATGAPEGQPGASSIPIAR